MDDAPEARTPKRIGSSRKLVMFNNIRTQLGVQLKCLEARVEAQTALASELQEYFRRRADLESDYSRGLDKLARSLAQRDARLKSNRDWFGGVTCWERLAEDTAALGRDHATLAELYGTRVAARLAAAADDAARLHRKCRDVAAEAHDDLLRVLGELYRAMKTHAALAGEWRAAAAKLRLASRARRHAPSDAPPRKLKPLDKELDKRRTKHAEAKLRALRARGEYVLCLEAANSTLHKYFTDDLSDLIDCMDLGYHGGLSRALRMHATADEGRARALARHAVRVHDVVDALDPQLDKQRFLEQHQQAFMVPRALSYRGDSPDEEDGDSDGECEADGGDTIVAKEEEERLAQLELRVRTLRAQHEEAAKTLHEAERNLLHMVEQEDWDARALFSSTDPPPDTPSTPAAPPLSPQHRSDTEDFYLAKLREYLSGGGQLSRLESATAALRARLGAPGADEPARRAWRARRAAAYTPTGVFAAPLEAHLVATQRELPLVLTSCCRVIRLYGLKHQGIFRVSGSQVEIATLRAGFERGEDPLAGVTDASDINSVAGLLKLYLRELRPPLFPPLYRERLLALAQLTDAEWTRGVREFLLRLPRAALVTLRYLFAFLHHLAEYSAYNMMDAWNLAICLGPTLLPVADERDQVLHQNLLNEFVKNLILQHEHVFPQHEPPFYTKRDLEAASEEVQADEQDGVVLAEEEPPAYSPPISLQVEEELEPVDSEESVERDPPSPVPHQLQEEAAAVRRTPDLVLDLPAGATPPDTPEAETSATTADTFLNNRDTLKRRVSPPPAPPTAPPTENQPALEKPPIATPPPVRQKPQLAPKPPRRVDSQPSNVTTPL